MFDTLSTFTQKQRYEMEVSAIDAARIVHKAKETVRRWTINELLPCRKEGLRGDIKIDIDDLRLFADKYGYRFDEEIVKSLN